MQRVFLLTICVLFIVNSHAWTAEASPSEAVGLTLAALGTEDLDIIQAAIGQRIGVMVTGVADGSPAAKAGVKVNDLLLLVAGQGVDSPQAIDKLLADKTGNVEIKAARPTDEGFTVAVCTLAMPAKGNAAPAKTTAPEKATLSPETQKKLAALEEAHKQGILTDEEYAKKRQALLGDKGKDAGKDTPAKDTATLPRAQGKLYQHPLGFSFWYPNTWTVKEAKNAPLQLIPPDAGTTPEGPSEIYSVLAEKVAQATIQRPDDPQILAYLDTQVIGLLPFLKRTGTPTAITMNNNTGTLVEWEGKNPKGDAVKARAFVCIMKGYGIALTALGVKDRVTRRDADLRQMFSSFGFGESSKDPRLIGNWCAETYTTSKDFSHTTVRYLTLRPDGSFSDSIRGFANMEHKDGGGNTTGHTTVDTGEAPGDRGRWGAANGRLFLMYDDGGFAEYTYEYANRSMLTYAGNGKKQLWSQQ